MTRLLLTFFTLILKTVSVKSGVSQTRCLGRDPLIPESGLILTEKADQVKTGQFNSVYLVPLGSERR